jgi:hypothetical protein
MDIMLYIRKSSFAVDDGVVPSTSKNKNINKKLSEEFSLYVFHLFNHYTIII